MDSTEVVVARDRQGILIRRIFDAPRAVVFQVYTDPEVIPKWWGPKEYGARVEYMDVTPGGRWKILTLDSAGAVFASSAGVYHSVVRDECIVRTVEFSRMAGRVQLHTDTFDDIDGKTRYTSVITCQSVEDRDLLVAIDAVAGLRETMDRFAILVAEKVARTPDNPSG